MKNHFQKLIEIEIQGKNIERFIRRLMRNQISLLQIKKLDEKCFHILVYSKDLEKIEEIKTIYEVTIVKKHGLLRTKEILKKNKILLLFLALGYATLLLLSHTIFSVEVIHTDKSLRELLLEETSFYGITKYHLKKSYKELTEIKEKILTTHKDRIEWLEIEEVGTKYIIRVEERILNQGDADTSYQDIVAKKSAIIMEINATSGQIVKNKLDYVKAGDTIISGYITLNEKVKDMVRAEGKVYGEVWYKVSVEYPLHYEEYIETKKEKTVLSFHFLNYTFELFNFKPFEEKKTESKTLLESNLLPFSFSIDKQKEVHSIKEDYTIEQAIEKASEKIREKIESGLSDYEYIIEIKQLKIEENNSTIILDAFVTVCEDITDTKTIAEYVEPIEPTE